jgi:hypothetical protein
MWGVWNEPNFPSWLNPWHRRLADGTREMTQPPLYRGLVNAAWRRLQASGHAGDTFLIGETAVFGNVYSMDFVKDLYCVGRGFRMLAGKAAAAVGCPKSPDRAAFVAGNPGLFAATGWAHHPYSLDIAPNRPYPVAGAVTLYNAGQLEGLLNRVLGSYGKKPSGGLPLYMTEWGYKTNPPNPFVKTTLAEQQAWLDEGDYMMWRDPFVQALTQFLLSDGAPRTQFPPTSPKYWFNWQTGLEFTDGKHKPSFGTYRVPIWLRDRRHGPRVTVWGQLRPADHSTAQVCFLEFHRKGTRTWTNLVELETSSPEGFLLNHVAIPSAGKVRLAWQNPNNGRTYHSRAVTVR